MAYEVFERTAVRVEDPTLAITPDGTIVFNAAASRILVGAGVKAVLLLWDKNTNKFAVKATSKGTETLTRFRQYTEGPHAVSGRSCFLTTLAGELTAENPCR